MSFGSTSAQSSQVVTPRSDVSFAPSALWQKVSDYGELVRVRIAVMTAVSVAVGYTLASPVVFRSGGVILALLGILPLVAASSIWNQCLEQRTDARMTRTNNRPVVAGRVMLWEAVSVGLVLACIGFGVLWQFVNPMTAMATLLTLVVYVFGYTLLKPHTSVCTTVGALPGAMPPVLGWLAAGQAPGIEAFCLFALFFVWQFPHFLAIGWMYRRDYQAAGLRMLPSFSDNGLLTGLLAVTYATAFIPISILPAYLNLSGELYRMVALILSLAYMWFSFRFAISRTDQRARQLLLYSLICLPALMLFLVIDFLRLTSFV